MFKNIINLFVSERGEETDPNVTGKLLPIRRSEQSITCNRKYFEHTDYDPPSIIDVEVVDWVEPTETDKVVVQLIKMYTDTYSPKCEHKTFSHSPFTPDVSEKLVSMYKTYKTFDINRISKEYTYFVKIYNEMNLLSFNELLTLVRSCSTNSIVDQDVFNQYMSFMVGMNLWSTVNKISYNNFDAFHTRVDKFFVDNNKKRIALEEGLNTELLKPIQLIVECEYKHLISENRKITTVLDGMEQELKQLNDRISLSKRYPILVDYHMKRVNELNLRIAEDRSVLTYINENLNTYKSTEYQNVKVIASIKTNIYRYTRTDSRIKNMWRFWYSNRDTNF
jgi:hypothetical protein